MNLYVSGLAVLTLASMQDAVTHYVMRRVRLKMCALADDALYVVFDCKFYQDPDKFCWCCQLWSQYERALLSAAASVSFRLPHPDILCET